MSVGTDPEYPWQTIWATPLGQPSLQDEALWGTALLGASRKTPGKYLVQDLLDTYDLMIPVICYYFLVIS